MTNSNGLALTTETRKSNMNNYGDHVLLEILAKSFGRNVWHGTPGQFRTAHPTLVEGAFKTLSLLELVKPDQDSPWGYRPTSNLTYQLLNPLTDRDKEHADEDDQKLLKKIIQASESQNCGKAERAFPTCSWCCGWHIGARKPMN